MHSWPLEDAFSDGPVSVNTIFMSHGLNGAGGGND